MIIILKSEVEAQVDFANQSKQWSPLLLGSGRDLIKATVCQIATRVALRARRTDIREALSTRGLLSI